MYYSSKKNNKPIYFSDDIIEEVAKITGKDTDLIEDVIKSNISYIKKSISEDDKIVVIGFPNLGKMRFNYYLGNCYASNAGLNKNSIIRKRLSYLRGLLDITNGNKLKNFNKPLVYTLFYNLEKSIERNILGTFYQKWKAIENKHNEEHEKYF